MGRGGEGLGETGSVKEDGRQTGGQGLGGRKRKTEIERGEETEGLLSHGSLPEPCG